MAKTKLSDYTVDTWNIDLQYPDGSPDETGMAIGLRKNGVETHAKGIFHITEKDGKLTAVVHLDQLAKRNIPVFLDIGCKMFDAVKHFAKRRGALKPKFYTICGFNYESCDDAYPIKNGKIYDTPEEAYPDVVKLANDIISNYDNGFDDTPKPITEADCTPEGYELNEDKFHLNIIIQEHTRE